MRTIKFDDRSYLLMACYIDNSYRACWYDCQRRLLRDKGQYYDVPEHALRAAADYAEEYHHFQKLVDMCCG